MHCFSTVTNTITMIVYTVYNFPTFISWEVLFLGLFSETHWHICKLNRNSIEFLEYGLFLANSFNYWGYFSQSNLPTFILVIIFFLSKTISTHLCFFLQNIRKLFRLSYKFWIIDYPEEPIRKIVCTVGNKYIRRKPERIIFYCTVVLQMKLYKQSNVQRTAYV